MECWCNEHQLADWICILVPVQFFSVFCNPASGVQTQLGLVLCMYHNPSLHFQPHPCFLLPSPVVQMGWVAGTKHFRFTWRQWWIFACPYFNPLLTTGLTLLVDQGAKGLLMIVLSNFFTFPNAQNSCRAYHHWKFVRDASMTFTKFLGFTGHKLTFHGAISEWSKRIVQYMFFHPCILICFCCISSFSVLFICCLRPQEVIESLGDGFTTQLGNENMLWGPYTSRHSAPH